MADDAVPDSWAPIDLGPYLRGEIVRPEPTCGLARSPDGLRMLYPGKEHSAIGEMESGKTWFALGCVATELATGNHVVYAHFEEADPTSTVERLVALGVGETEILSRFQFVGPERRVDADALAALLDPVPSLVVIDGVNEAMALHGWGIRAEDGAAEFRRRLVKPFTRAGAAVLSLDHVVKDAETRGRYGLGSVHKGNGLTGSLILLDNVEPFGRDQRGRSRVLITKDRPGFLRQHGKPVSGCPGRTYLGELVIDSTAGRLDMAFYGPRAEQSPTSTDPSAVADEKIYTAVGDVIATGNDATVSKVRAISGMRGTAVDEALDRLVMAGRLVERQGKRNSRIFVPTVSGDQLS